MCEERDLRIQRIPVLDRVPLSITPTYAVSHPHTRNAAPGSLHSSEVVELLLEWWPDDRLLWPWLGPWRLPLRILRPESSTGRPWTIPLRASMPPLTEKFRQTIKARMAAFSCASVPDSYDRSVWYSRPLTRTRHVKPCEPR